jgi:hypothetical protein
MELARPVCLEFIDAINEKQKSQNTYVDWIYLNYLCGNEKPYLYYGQDNIDHLHQVAKKYDPNSVFQKLCQTGYKLPEHGEEHNI